MSSAVEARASRKARDEPEGRSAPAGRPRASAGRWLVQCGNSRESVVGYLSGWAAIVDGFPVGFLRSSPRLARRDLLAHALEHGGTPKAAA